MKARDALLALQLSYPNPLIRKRAADSIVTGCVSSSRPSRSQFVSLGQRLTFDFTFQFKPDGPCKIPVGLDRQDKTVGAADHSLAKVPFKIKIVVQDGQTIDCDILGKDLIADRTGMRPGIWSVRRM